MTTANKIAILRDSFAIPVFIVQILYYFKNGDERHRWAGLLCFGLAAAWTGWMGISRGIMLISGVNSARYLIRLRTSCCWFPD